MNNQIESAEYAQKVDQRIKNLRYSVDTGFLDLTKSLKEVRDKKLYLLLDMDTFESYIAQPEIALDRGNVYKFIAIYETYIENYKVAPERLLEAGWTKLSKIIPYTNEHNYEAMLEKATTLSRSDLDKDLVEQGYITRKEPEAQFVTCPYCHKEFVPDKRQDQTFPQADYKKVIDAYIEVKEITPQGDEYRPIQQAIKTLFLNGRTPDEIISALHWLKDNAEYSWTMQTLAHGKIAEILQESGYKPKKELSESDKKLLRNSGLTI